MIAKLRFSRLCSALPKRSVFDTNRDPTAVFSLQNRPKHLD